MIALKYGLCIFFGLVSLSCANEEEPRVSTKLGDISGKRINVEGKLLDQFLGIPFAKPLTKHFRFRKAEAIEKYDALIEADTMPSVCPQTITTLVNASGMLPHKIDEDCLYLNIWSPVDSDETDALKPVMFWIYGGAFQMGSNSFPFYNGMTLASFGDVIVVSPNYRVGSFGFFSAGSEEEPGNLGLYDQNLALQWVQQNIASFGGDPERVTIFGESAGGMSVSYHTISPKSKGLFKRAILESGTHLTSLYYVDPQPLLDAGLQLAQKVGCASGSENFLTHRERILSCLRSKDMADILKAEKEVRRNSFVPLYGEKFLPLENVKDISIPSRDDIDILIGANEEEGNMMLFSFGFDKDFEDPQKMMKKTESLEFVTKFVATNFLNAEKITAPYFENVEEDDVIGCRQAFSDIVTDGYFVCPSIVYANAVAKKVNNFYFYFFTHFSTLSFMPQSWMHATHFAEVPYVFGVPTNPLFNYPKEDVEFSKSIMTIWTNFAKEGKVPDWKRYESASNIAYELNPLRNSSLEIPRANRCYELWAPAFENQLSRSPEPENLRAEL